MSNRLFLFVNILSFSAAILLYQNCSPFEGLSGSNNSFGDLPATSELQGKSIEILTTNCKSCHGDQNLGGIGDVTDLENLTSSGLIVAGDLEGSRLLRSVFDNSMPPSGPLLESDKQILRGWVLALGGLDPNGEPIDFQFGMTLSASPLPFRNRIGKINYVVGGENSSGISSLYDSRYLLGDYDFANTVVPNYAWEASDANNWIQAVEPVCSSAEILSKYSWPDSRNQFAIDMFARTLDPEESALLDPIAQLNVDNQEKMEVYCLTLMTSLEFISK